MTVAVILRLVAGTLAEGRVAGRAEIVDTGETVNFKDQQEMLAILLRSAPGNPAEPRGALPVLHGEPSTEDQPTT